MSWSCTARMAAGGVPVPLGTAGLERGASACYSARRAAR